MKTLLISLCMIFGLLSSARADQLVFREANRYSPRSVLRELHRMSHTEFLVGPVKAGSIMFQKYNYPQGIVIQDRPHGGGLARITIAVSPYGNGSLIQVYEWMANPLIQIGHAFGTDVAGTLRRKFQ